MYKINVVGLIKKLRIESIEKERQRRRDLKEEYEVYIGKTMRLFIIRKKLSQNDSVPSSVHRLGYVSFAVSIIFILKKIIWLYILYILKIEKGKFFIHLELISKLLQ